ncbi:hypothetical protein [Adonisia turfae]|uniref:hypothetical protein n=1 Tax=Adonisia turfae TaxID=2950184 RepID=UPI0013D2F87B|nr:hypothetical protein [Adonisia turfae]
MGTDCDRPELWPLKLQTMGPLEIWDVAGYTKFLREEPCAQCGKRMTVQATIAVIDVKVVIAEDVDGEELTWLSHSEFVSGAE